jgi:mediator of RNA polymerase II transcription subunit 14
MSPSITSNLLYSLEDLIRFKLRVTEIVPAEMSQYRIESGRVHFRIPQLFETSLTLNGSSEYDCWLFIHVEFLCLAGGASATLQGTSYRLSSFLQLESCTDFPTRPSGLLEHFIRDEANSQLRCYTPMQPSHLSIPTDVSVLTPIALPKGVVNAPLIRLYNFLRQCELKLYCSCTDFDQRLWLYRINLRSSASR